MVGNIKRAIRRRRVCSTGSVRSRKAYASTRRARGRRLGRQGVCSRIATVTAQTRSPRRLISAVTTHGARRTCYIDVGRQFTMYRHAHNARRCARPDIAVWRASPGSAGPLPACAIAHKSNSRRAQRIRARFNAALLDVIGISSREAMAPLIHMHAVDCK